MKSLYGFITETSQFPSNTDSESITNVKYEFFCSFNGKAKCPGSVGARKPHFGNDVIMLLALFRLHVKIVDNYVCRSGGAVALVITYHALKTYGRDEF